MEKRTDAEFISITEPAAQVGMSYGMDLAYYWIWYYIFIENKSEITISNWNKDKVSNSSDNPWNISPSMSCALALLLLVQHCQLLQLAKRIEDEIE